MNYERMSADVDNLAEDIADLHEAVEAVVTDRASPQVQAALNTFGAAKTALGGFQTLGQGGATAHELADAFGPVISGIGSVWNMVQQMPGSVEGKRGRTLHGIYQDAAVIAGKLSNMASAGRP